MQLFSDVAVEISPYSRLLSLLSLTNTVCWPLQLVQNSDQAVDTN